VSIILERVGPALVIVYTVAFVYALACPRWAEWQYERPQLVVAEAALPARLDSQIAPMAENDVAPVLHPLADPPTLAPPSSVVPPPRHRLAEERQASVGGLAEEPTPSDAGSIQDDSGQLSYGRTVRMQIPRIRINSRVLEVGIANGE